MTTAQIISAKLDNDGQKFDTVDGISIDTLCADVHGAGYPSFRDGHGTDTYRYNFADGSAIVVAGGCWDLSVDDYPCYCMAGAGHSEACTEEQGL